MDPNAIRGPAPWRPSLQMPPQEQWSVQEAPPHAPHGCVQHHQEQWRNSCVQQAAPTSQEQWMHPRVHDAAWTQEQWRHLSVQQQAPPTSQEQLRHLSVQQAPPTSQEHLRHSSVQQAPPTSQEHLRHSSVQQAPPTTLEQWRQSSVHRPQEHPISQPASVQLQLPSSVRPQQGLPIHSSVQQPVPHSSAPSAPQHLSVQQDPSVVISQEQWKQLQLQDTSAASDYEINSVIMSISASIPDKSHEELRWDAKQEALLAPVTLMQRAQLAKALRQQQAEVQQQQQLQPLQQQQQLQSLQQQQQLHQLQLQQQLQPLQQQQQLQSLQLQQQLQPLQQQQQLQPLQQQLLQLQQQQLLQSRQQQQQQPRGMEVESAASPPLAPAPSNSSCNILPVYLVLPGAASQYVCQMVSQCCPGGVPLPPGYGPHPLTVMQQQQWQQEQQQQSVLKPQEPIRSRDNPFGTLPQVRQLSFKNSEWKPAQRSRPSSSPLLVARPSLTTSRSRYRRSYRKNDPTPPTTQQFYHYNPARLSFLEQEAALSYDERSPQPSSAPEMWYDTEEAHPQPLAEKVEQALIASVEEARLAQTPAAVEAIEEPRLPGELATVAAAEDIAEAPVPAQEEDQAAAQDEDAQAAAQDEAQAAAQDEAQAAVQEEDQAEAQAAAQEEDQAPEPADADTEPLEVQTEAPTGTDVQAQQLAEAPTTEEAPRVVPQQAPRVATPTFCKLTAQGGRLVKTVEASTQTEAPAECTLPIVARDDYYVRPSLETLMTRELRMPGYCEAVESFVVGCRGHGEVKFLGKTDVQGLDVCSIIQFDEHEVLGYMDERNKPPAGQGLNKPAEVTLFNIYCTDGNSGAQCHGGPEAHKFEMLLREQAKRQGSQFVSYDAATGEWKFLVDHFSKYGC